MSWGEKHHYIIFDWSDNHLVGRFATREDAIDHRKRFMKSFQSWTIYKEIC